MKKSSILVWIILFLFPLCVAAYDVPTISEKTEGMKKFSGYFTALIGYEWTTTKNAKNLHRVVIFKDDASKAGQIIPFSSFDSSDPEDLWSFLEKYEKEGSCYYSTSRLWDDGVIDPRKTREILGLAVETSLKEKIEETKFGIFRM